MKRIGVDIGGTFTDIVVLDEETGDLWATKVPSTPERVANAAITGLREAVDVFGVLPKSVRFVAHGSTIGTNTVIQRTGAKTALVTTKGFRDVLEFGRVARPAGFLYGPAFRRYIEIMSGHVEREFDTRLYLMQSNGGLLTSAAAQEQPVRALESGPTAGVMGAVHIAKLMNLQKVISFDMGGTTAKAGLIIGGESVETVEYEVGGLAAAPGSGHLHGRGTGFPISLPAVEVTEIGSGGGSVAWIDAGGAFRVGPQSMGAKPGPACYGFGGAEPTVTDAQVVLGVINPKNFLGGKMTLLPDLSVRAIETRIAKPLGMTVQQAAQGIAKIANAAMAQATRLVSINKGHDPREFALLAFGGAGPMHACDIARDLEIPWIIVPRYPGLHSALGLVVSDIVHDFIRAYAQRQLKTDVLINLFDELEGNAMQALDVDQVPANDRRLLRTADLRYKGQTHTVNVVVPGGPVDDTTVRAMVANFHQKHEALYTFRSADTVVELVNVRLRGVGVIPRPEAKPSPAADASPKGATTGRRRVFFDGQAESLEVDIFDRVPSLPTSLRHRPPLELL